MKWISSVYLMYESKIVLEAMPLHSFFTLAIILVNLLSVEHTVTIAFSCGGFLAATCNELKPPHEIPIMPTLPLLQGCCSIHFITSKQSSCSCSKYSSVLVRCQSSTSLTTLANLFPSSLISFFVAGCVTFEHRAVGLAGASHVYSETGEATASEVSVVELISEHCFISLPIWQILQHTTISATKWN